MQREVQGGREQERLECRLGYLRNPPRARKKRGNNVASAPGFSNANNAE